MLGDIIGVLETLNGSMEGLKFKSTSVEYDSGVSDCIYIVEMAINLFKTVQDAKLELVRKE